jgi:16S rRNA (adenine1518-N6/adenine1519-N6)-dimethyltransferase
MSIIKAKKSLGQHFLCDRNICSSIINSSIAIHQKVVVEIGPGYGALTSEILAKNPKHLFLIEKDRDLAARLRLLHANNTQVTLIQGDALCVSLSSLSDEKVVIISNLPFNIGTKLLKNWLCNEREQIYHLTLMMQKEVADRVCAPVGDKDYGRLSILCQFLAKTEKSFDVPKEAFLPQPKVISSILQITPFTKTVNLEEFNLLQEILRAAFSLKRKAIKTSLKAFLSSQDFLTIGIACSEIPRKLTIEDFLKIVSFKIKQG